MVEGLNVGGQVEATINGPQTKSKPGSSDRRPGGLHGRPGGKAQ